MKGTLPHLRNKVKKHRICEETPIHILLCGATTLWWYCKTNINDSNHKCDMFCQNQLHFGDSF